MTEKFSPHKLAIEFTPEGEGIGPTEERFIETLTLHERLRKMAENIEENGNVNPKDLHLVKTP